MIRYRISCYWLKSVCRMDGKMWISCLKFITIELWKRPPAKWPWKNRFQIKILTKNRQILKILENSIGWKYTPRKLKSWKYRKIIIWNHYRKIIWRNPKKWEMRPVFKSWRFWGIHGGNRAKIWKIRIAVNGDFQKSLYQTKMRAKMSSFCHKGIEKVEISNKCSPAKIQA